MRVRFFSACASSVSSTTCLSSAAKSLSGVDSSIKVSEKATSLAKASTWLGTYFRLNERGVAALEEELNALAVIPVTRDLPDISGSLAVLKDYIDQLHSVGSRTAEAAAADADEETP